MINKGLFKRPSNPLEGQANQSFAYSPEASIPDEMCVSCPSCQKMLFSNDLMEKKNVCEHCGHHFRLNARQRLSLVVDIDSFYETDYHLRSTNLLRFPGYDEKLKNAARSSAEADAVVTGVAQIGGLEVAIFVMEPYFMMGSMGVIVGEKITNLFELATKKSLPVVGFTVSGGARMQEGILSLMQMAKISGAVKRHSDQGNFYLIVLTDPTTGGVTASFAMEADIALAEPGALIGFAGPRVIEQTIRQKLPKGFQSAEFLLEKGFVDAIVPRSEQAETIAKLLNLHQRRRRS